ncbi:MAG: hypothetical protein DME22_20455 [Verrucomicrobia bacterium]|nr:MAG: hypothetical protein DME22_20455 [Verrucomicrobiota bacterium]PYK03159.1 MAG: hypothetical protein DME23_00345 [Verrucomicrobiota bacterium]
MLQRYRRYAIEFVSDWFYNITGFGERALPAPVAVSFGGMTRMRRLLPYLIWLSGLLLLVIGVFVGPGVPYQDPTREMRTIEARQTRLGDSFMMAGLIVFASGVLWAVVAGFVRRGSRPNDT